MRDARIVVFAYDWVPDFAQGHVRDLRVRWALEEAGLPYETRLVTHEEKIQGPHLARQPFGQIPVMEIDGETMFESGAIVWTIAEASETLLPKDLNARRRVMSWFFAALNSVEPPFMTLAWLELFAKEKEAAARLKPETIERFEKRLERLDAALGEADYLAGDFSAADLMMAAVLRPTHNTGLFERFPRLARYIARCECRPGFQKALADQLEPFRENGERYGSAA